MNREWRNHFPITNTARKKPPVTRGRLRAALKEYDERKIAKELDMTLEEYRAL